MSDADPSFADTTPPPPRATGNGRWEPPTAEELHALLPGYAIEMLLGKGGMGAVYKGRQISLDRPVAIKILSNDLEAVDASFSERFKNEALSMAKLSHPGIVAVYDFGEAPGGLLYIVMEFIDGTDVAKMISQSGRLHTEHAMAITAHVCDALAYAHERGIIHRDIKPANIMVNYDGAVKVADFGLAKVSAGSGETLGLTQSGMALGTLHFMAPEALMLGTAVDHRADIYAVGVMLYQMLTGKLPQGLFKMPSLLVPGLDPRYDAIIAKGIMEDREARYQSVREMRADLDGILTQPVVKADPAAPAQQAALLPTNARPQRPGMRQAPQPASHGARAPAGQPQAGSLAWLWVTTLVLAVLGGVGWFILGTPKPTAADTSAPPASPPPKVSAVAVNKVVAAPPAPAARAPVASTPADEKRASTGPDGKTMEQRVEKSAPPASAATPASTTAKTFNDHRYQFVPGSFTWQEAKARAEGMGGHLATINTQEENEWLLLSYRNLFNHVNQNIWLGASESAPGAGWKWVTGEPFAPLGWSPGEPNGVKGGGGSVGHPFMLNLYHFSNDKIGWNDSSTHESQVRANIGFIVEWEDEPAAKGAPAATASATTWIDTKGRSLQAQFVSLKGTSVILNIAGKSTPVPLSALSAASQEIAQALNAERSQPASKIPADALSFGSSRYAYYPGTHSWKAAKAKAEALGGHLATVTTAAEDAWVVENFASKVAPGRKQFWIGASQERPNRPWQWVTGEAFSYTQWAPGEPNNAKGTDAKSTPPYMLGYVLQGGHMGWNDFSESQENWRDIIVGYLVEWDNAASANAAKAATPAVSTTPAPAETGFVSLFEADQAREWEQVGPGQMELKNGVGTNTSPSKWGVAVYSKRKFSDFILKAEFKGMGPVFNSGIWLRISTARKDIEQATNDRYEVGIRHSTGDLGRTTGCIWGVQPARLDALKKDEWNEMEITAKGQHIEVKLNGQIVNDFTGDKARSGYIGLEENNEGPVQFRHVRIKALP